MFLKEVLPLIQACVIVQLLSPISLRQSCSSHTYRLCTTKHGFSLLCNRCQKYLILYLKFIVCRH